MVEAIHQGLLNLDGWLVPFLKTKTCKLNNCLSCWKKQSMTDPLFFCLFLVGSFKKIIWWAQWFKAICTIYWSVIIIFTLVAGCRGQTFAVLYVTVYVENTKLFLLFCWGHHLEVLLSRTPVIIIQFNGGNWSSSQSQLFLQLQFRACLHLGLRRLQCLDQWPRSRNINKAFAMRTATE